MIDPQEPTLLQAETIFVQALESLPQGATVLDYGCYGWQAAGLSARLGRHDLRQIGLDLHEEPPGRPPQAEFLLLPAPGAPIPACMPDFIVASHVIEHCADGVGVLGTMIAALRPGGRIYIETPSELTALLPSDPDVEGQAFTSFWDDPTHIRPWPLAALYRLALSWGARPESCRHAMRGPIHCSTALIRRIDPAPPRYRYVSLADVPRGVEAALAHVSRRTEPNA